MNLAALSCLVVGLHPQIPVSEIEHQRKLQIYSPCDTHELAGSELSCNEDKSCGYFLMSYVRLYSELSCRVTNSPTGKTFLFYKGCATTLIYVPPADYFETGKLVLECCTTALYFAPIPPSE